MIACLGIPFVGWLVILFLGCAFIIVLEELVLGWLKFKAREQATP